MATLNIKSFPEDLYQNLSRLAKAEKRSLSSEVVYLLEWAIDINMPKKNSILQLRGLGKKKRKSVNIAKHIEKERNSWN